MRETVREMLREVLPEGLPIKAFAQWPSAQKVCAKLCAKHGPDSGWRRSFMRCFRQSTHTIRLGLSGLSRWK